MPGGGGIERPAYLLMERFVGDYGDPAAQRAQATKIMEKHGYGPNNKLKVKVATRDFNTFRDPAVILIDQLNKIHFERRDGTGGILHLAQPPDQDGLRRRHEYVRRRHR